MTVKDNLAKELHSICMDEMSWREYDEDDFVELMGGVIPTALKELYKRPRWTLDVGLRVAEALELEQLSLEKSYYV